MPSSVLVLSLPCQLRGGVARPGLQLTFRSDSRATEEP